MFTPVKAIVREAEGVACLGPNVAVHPAEGRREAPLPTVGCNAWFGHMVLGSREGLEAQA